MSLIFEIENLEKRFNSFKLDNICLKLEEGYIMGLAGPNGAGKTTLLNLMLGLLKPDAGKIKIFGRDLAEDEFSIKQDIGFILDESSWYESFRISEMSSLVSSFYRCWNQVLFNDYLKRFDLTAGQKIGSLSKGMKMKFSLATALSHNAKLIIMDEPTSGLDPIVRAEFLEILQRLIAEEGRSVLLSSHISSDIEQVADYITFINQGKIVFSESREAISDRYLIIKGPAELLDRDISSGFAAVRIQDSRFSALCTEPQLLEGEFTDLIRKGKVVRERARIDDIMLHYVKGEQHV